MSGVLLALIAAPLFAARNPDPPQRLPLAPFGFQTISERYLLQGATMVTVDFVDSSHLLVTFGISRLMPRLPECPAEDEDRTVKAVLLELPTGRELAATEWRFHDLGQYLWNLGDGHFLLRNRDTLSTISPLQNLSSREAGEAFAQQPFLHFNSRIEAVLVSADHDLLTVETVKPKLHANLDSMLQTSNQTSATSNANSQTAPAHPVGLLRRDPNAVLAEKDPVEISFIRLVHSSPAQIAAVAGARIRTEKVVNIPLTTDGYLETRGESRDGVLFHFITYTGTDLDLGDFPTSCHPRSTFVSHSEFVTYGCRGADDSLDLTGFNLRGDMIWQINFNDTQAYPSFAAAPSAGRFAFSRTITTSNVFGSETPSASQLTAQEIRVIQTYNGKQLIRAVASPIQRAGQNYALSPDGLTLAVIHDIPAAPQGPGEKPAHDTAVELFKLPALSSKDLAEIKTASAMAPQTANAPMRFSLKEIREALNAGADTAKSESHRADASIVGDSIKPQAAQPDTTIPVADPAPACANLAKTSADACPAAPKTVANDQPVEANADTSQEPEKRRKPPTLFEPDPAATPKPPQH